VGRGTGTAGGGIALAAAAAAARAASSALMSSSSSLLLSNVLQRVMDRVGCIFQGCWLWDAIFERQLSMLWSSSHPGDMQMAELFLRRFLEPR